MVVIHPTSHVKSPRQVCPSSCTTSCTLVTKSRIPSNKAVGCKWHKHEDKVDYISDRPGGGYSWPSCCTDPRDGALCTDMHCAYHQFLQRIQKQSNTVLEKGFHLNLDFGIWTFTGIGSSFLYYQEIRYNCLERNWDFLIIVKRTVPLNNSEK